MRRAAISSAGGTTSRLGVMPSGVPEVKPLEGTPSALKRQVRKALNPEMDGTNIYPAKRGVNEQGNARIMIDNGSR